MYLVIPSFEICNKLIEVLEPERISVKVAVYGNPPPDINWVRVKDETVLSEDHRISFNTGETFSQLIINNSSRLTDTSVYRLVLSNEMGAVECDIDVKVYGK